MSPDAIIAAARQSGFPEVEPGSFRALPVRAAAFITFVIAVGAWLFVCSLDNWTNHYDVQFFVYLLIAVGASFLKIELPNVNGSMSITFFFILIGIADLSLPQTMVIACAGAIALNIFRARQKPRLHQVLFNIGGIATAVWVSFGVYTSPVLKLWIHTDWDLKPVALAAAAACCFVMNTLSVSLVIGMTERRPTWQVWSACYFWCFPYYLVGACIAWGISSLDPKTHWQFSLLTLPVLYLVYRSYQTYLDRLRDEKEHAEDMTGLHLRTIEALAMAIEAKDQNTFDHLRRVRIYAIEIGKELGLNRTELDALRAAALLHDIGKLAVPEHIISKPGKLTPEEFEKMKIHPTVGADILRRVEFPYDVASVVECHHEKWDGTGYPAGLKSHAIPIGARILSAVDCLDALASDRQYRKALPLAKAMEIVAGESGKSFDPQVVEILERRHVELEQLAINQPEPSIRLSTDLKIERGLAPANGFEQPAVSRLFSDRADPLSSIAAARQEVQMLFELTQEMGRSLNMAEMLSVFAVGLKRLVPYDSIAIYIKRDQKLHPEFVNGENFRLFSSLEIPVGQGLSGWVAENNKSIRNGNPSVEAGYLCDPNKFSTLRSAAAVPLQGVSGTIGVLSIYRLEKDAFSVEDHRILLAVGSKLAISLENALRYQKAERSAVTDFLTNLPNARSLYTRLENELARCKRTGIPFTLLVCDLDSFKAINDRFGHLEGDKVLRHVARKLRENCREYDYVARMGGDEFVMIIPGLTAETAEARINTIRESISDASRVLPEPENVTMSVGASFFPQDSADTEELLSTADLRMYKAKRRHQVAPPARHHDLSNVTVLPLTYSQ
jgi:diguanylate cyclase (GGDEF)-like protein/putative nucleotidyltransferase with HDIG domain